MFSAAFMVLAALVPLGLADPPAAEPEAEEEALGAAPDDAEPTAPVASEVTAAAVDAAEDASADPGALLLAKLGRKENTRHWGLLGLVLTLIQPLAQAQGQGPVLGRVPLLWRFQLRQVVLGQVLLW